MNEDKIKEVINKADVESEEVLKKLLDRVTHLEDKVKDRKSKFFLKSKTVVVNAFVAVASILGIAIDVFGGLISTQLEYLKTVIPNDKIFLLFAALAVFNIYKRFGEKDKVVLKKKEETNNDDENS